MRDGMIRLGKRVSRRPVPPDAEWETVWQQGDGKHPKLGKEARKATVPVGKRRVAAGPDEICNCPAYTMPTTVVRLYGTWPEGQKSVEEYLSILRQSVLDGTVSRRDAHVAADAVLLGALSSLGHDLLVRRFREIPKEYGG